MTLRKVLIADVSPLFCQGLRVLLNAQPGFQVIGEASSREELHQKLDECEADLLLVNHSLLPETDQSGRIDVVPLEEPFDRAKLVQSLQRLSAAVVEASLQPQQAQRTANTQTTLQILTTREQEVLQLLAHGRTVKATALELGLSRKTAEAHTLNIMRKLNVHDRESLIEYARDFGAETVSR